MDFEQSLEQIRNNQVSYFNWTQPGLTQQNIIDLGAALKVNSSLSSLVLRNNSELGDVNLQPLFDGLAKHPGIFSVDLQNNELGDVAASYAANLIGNNPVISSLDLSANKIGDDGATKIAQALNASNLQQLLFNKNSIGDNGLTAIGSSLEANKNITQVHISNNMFGDTGVQAFAKSIEKNNCVDTVYFVRDESSVKFGNEPSAQAIIHAVEIQTKITGFSLDGSGISSDDLNKINNILQMPPQDRQKLKEQTIEADKAKQYDDLVNLEVEQANSSADEVNQQEVPAGINKPTAAALQNVNSASTSTTQSVHQVVAPIIENDTTTPTIQNVNQAALPTAKAVNTQLTSTINSAEDASHTIPVSGASSNALDAEAISSTLF